MLPMGGRRLVEWVIAALAPQVGRFLISCGQDAEPYTSLGQTTVTDLRPGDGPLGGIVSALPYVETDWLLTHPGDAPFADGSLVGRLAPTAEASGIAVPRAGAHRQNLVLLMSRQKANDLARFYELGGRAARDWLDGAHVTSVDMSDAVDSFFNVNTAADLAECERRLADPR
jgi:molybdopterin-guanine dinucleotide biosynthesis protein A